MSSVYEVAFGHETLSIETGKLAEQANGSVVVRYGDVMMLVTYVRLKVHVKVSTFYH